MKKRLKNLVPNVIYISTVHMNILTMYSSIICFFEIREFTMHFFQIISYKTNVQLTNETSSACRVTIL
jgi:hypothetical protein